MTNNHMPPAIFIAWSHEDQAWIATTLIVESPLFNDSSGDGATPQAALAAMYEKLLCMSGDYSLPTMSIEMAS